MEVRKITQAEYPEALRMYSVCFEYDEGLGDLSADRAFLKKVTEEAEKPHGRKLGLHLGGV